MQDLTAHSEIIYFVFTNHTYIKVLHSLQHFLKPSFSSLLFLERQKNVQHYQYFFLIQGPGNVLRVINNSKVTQGTVRSTRDQIALKCAMATKFGRKNS